MYRVVIDTNLLIDGAEDFYHYGNRILDLVIGGQITAFANKSTLRENKFLSVKKISDEGYLKKLEYFFDTIKPVENIERIDVVEDKEDNKILESALACKADYLITSDRHLLKIERYKGIKIVTPSKFWSVWEEEGEGWTKWIKDFIR
ncbi:MAG: putative toxin-antitoxin system toxin component, PIN family [Candidatus Doudnabacteria bacterium]|nr:putative toxin-antitoxin system toxin component, PIN family [Candidatus Doudnabacteria bacterium]